MMNICRRAFLGIAFLALLLPVASANNFVIDPYRFAAGGGGQGIGLVGVANGSSINGGNITISLTALTGGQEGFAGSAPLEGDTVVVYTFVNRDGSATNNVGISTSGYTTTRDDEVSPGQGFQLYGRKRMGGSPDTQVVLTGTGVNDDAMAAVALVYRNVNATIDDASPTLASGENTNPDAPAITAATAGATVLVFAGDSALDGSVTAPANYTMRASASGDDTRDSQVYAADRRNLPTGSENPAAFANWSNGDWKAMTVALRPAP